MFDDIAARYDLANTIMTLGLDRRWRRRTAERALGDVRAATALDCACGTGALTAALQRCGAHGVIGLDFSERMIAAARRRHPALRFMSGDVSHLPFAEDSFDAVTVGFGLRNLADPAQGLREMRRVLREGGRLAVLEAVRPEGGMEPVLQLAARLGPALAGRLVGRSAAYRYLTETVRNYTTAAGLARWLRDAGLRDVGTERAGLGAVAIVWGTKSTSNR